MEVGLRIKLRFNASNDPENIFNSNGDGSYSFAAGDACATGGFGFAPFPLCMTTPIWNLEWSVNTDYLDLTGTPLVTLDDFIYELGMDSDPSSKTNYTVFDNISPSLVAPAWDHAVGDNLTANGAGVSNLLTYGAALTTENVAQNSWSYEFFNNLGTSLEFFDPAVAGEYTIYLKVKDLVKGKTVAESVIRVLVTP